MPKTGSKNTIDHHPQRDRIIERLLNGDQPMKIGKEAIPPVHHRVVQRYMSEVIRPHLAQTLLSTDFPHHEPPPALTPKSEKEAAKDLARDILRAPITSVFRQRLESLHTRVERVLDKAERTPKQFAAIAPLINQAHKNIEMLGRATGELEMHPGTNLAIQIICPSAPTPESVRISFDSQDAIEQGPASDSTQEIGIQQE